jgi:FkbM family methyltransferase
MITVKNNWLALNIAKRRWVRRLGVFQLPDQTWITHHGHRIYLDTKDLRGPSYHLMNWGVSTYESEVAATALKVFPHNGVFVDVGANIGIFTYLMATQGQARKVYAFEPEPSTLNCLRRTIEANCLNGRVEVINQGLSNASGTAQFFVSAENRGGHSLEQQALVDENLTVKETLTVEISTLDQLVESKQMTQLDLIKVDVQRHETAVLEGATHSIHRFQPTIMAEIHAESWDAITTPLAEQGYALLVPKTSNQLQTASEAKRIFQQESAEYLDTFFIPPSQTSMFESSHH